MKAYHSLIIFAVLVLSAAFTSISSYRKAQYAIVKDMNHAATLALQAEEGMFISPDTIKTYRSFLRHDALREKSVLTYVLGSHAEVLSGKCIKWRQYEVQGIANCSMADVFGMSNQRVPFSLTVVAMLWAMGSVYYFRKRKVASSVLPLPESAMLPSFPFDKQNEPSERISLSYDAQADRFMNAEQEVLRLTPMQHQLMCLFFSNAQHRLEKQTICDTLWPKKPDASETLYTLIRRIKPIIEQNSDMTIASERGKAYSLVKK